MHCVTAWMITCPLSVEWLDTASHVSCFYLSILFYQYSIVCVLSVKHLANLLLHNPC